LEHPTIPAVIPLAATRAEHGAKFLQKQRGDLGTSAFLPSCLSLSVAQVAFR
jgi:hypothetical protein